MDIDYGLGLHTPAPEGGGNVGEGFIPSPRANGAERTSAGGGEPRPYGRNALAAADPQNNDDPDENARVAGLTRRIEELA